MTLHTATEVAEEFQVTPQFVRKQAREKRWPHLKLGERAIRFTDEHLEQIKQETFVPVVPAEQARATSREQKRALTRALKKGAAS